MAKLEETRTKSQMADSFSSMVLPSSTLNNPFMSTWERGLGLKCRMNPMAGPDGSDGSNGSNGSDGSDGSDGWNESDESDSFDESNGSSQSHHESSESSESYSNIIHYTTKGSQNGIHTNRYIHGREPIYPWKNGALRNQSIAIMNYSHSRMLVNSCNTTMFVGKQANK